MSRTAATGRKRKRWACNNRDCDWLQPEGTHKPENGRCPRCAHPTLSKRWVQLSEGAVSHAMMMDWVNGRGVELRGAGVDESPHCYKRLPEVLDYHSDTIRILHTLTPIGVAMAAPTDFDPYKD